MFAGAPGDPAPDIFLDGSLVKWNWSGDDPPKWRVEYSSDAVNWTLHAEDAGTARQANTGDPGFYRVAGASEDLLEILTPWSKAVELEAE